MRSYKFPHFHIIFEMHVLENMIIGIKMSIYFKIWLCSYFDDFCYFGSIINSWFGSEMLSIFFILHNIKDDWPRKHENRHSNPNPLKTMALGSLFVTFCHFGSSLASYLSWRNCQYPQIHIKFKISDIKNMRISNKIRVRYNIWLWCQFNSLCHFGSLIGGWLFSE